MKTFSLLLLSLIFIPLTAKAKTPLTINDFTLLGGFRVPTSISYAHGLSYRNKPGVGGVLYTSGNYGGFSSMIEEIKIPDTLTVAKPFAPTTSIDYGNVFQDKITTLNNDGTYQPPMIGLTSKFTGSISGTTMTVTSIPAQTPLYIGKGITGAGVAQNTRISGFLTGSGGVGDYTVSVSQEVPSELLTGAGASAGTVFWDETDQRLYWLSPISYENPSQSASFTGSISGNILTVTNWSSSYNTVQIGQGITGTGVTSGTIITGNVTGWGMNGTYTVSNNQNVSAESMTSGASCQSNSSIGYSILDDVNHTGTGIGAWQLDKRGACGGFGGRWQFQMVNIPNAFSNTYAGGRKFAVGFGGSVSIDTNGPPSYGPALGIMDHAPDLAHEPHLGVMSTPPIPVVSHFYGESRGYLPNGLTCYNGRDGDSTYFGQSHYWTVSDESYYGTWIEGENKQGILMFALVGGGDAHGTITGTTSKSNVTVDNPGDIQAGDVLRVSSDACVDCSHGAYEYRIPVLSVNGNTITFSSPMNGNPVIGGTVTAGTWYRGGGADVTRMRTLLYIYSEDDVAAVISGAKTRTGITESSVTDWKFPGVTYPLPGGPYGASTVYPNVVQGVAYDDVNQRLYVMSFASGGFEDVYVYQLNDSASTLNPYAGYLRTGLAHTLFGGGSFHYN